MFSELKTTNEKKNSYTHPQNEKKKETKSRNKKQNWKSMNIKRAKGKLFQCKMKETARKESAKNAEKRGNFLILRIFYFKA